MKKLLNECNRRCAAMALLWCLVATGPASADPRAHVEARADLARAAHNINGRGVIVAIADRGIDWRNQDFRNADGSTRIAGIFDLSDDTGANAPGNPYGAGTLYTRAQIDAALSGGPQLATRDAVGHGTASAGGCCGNGRNSNGQFIGFAPEATIVAIKVVSEGAPAHGSVAAEAPFDRTEQLPKAIQYVKALSAQLGMPAVMLWNFGSIGEPADGTSTLAKLIDASAGPGIPGFAIVSGTGDDGGSANHAAGSIAPGQTIDLQFTRGASNQTTPLQLNLYHTAQTSLEATLLTPAGTLGPFAVVARDGYEHQTPPGIDYWQLGADATPLGDATNNGKGRIRLEISAAPGAYTLRLRNPGSAAAAFDAYLNPARTAGPASTDSAFLSFVVPGHSIAGSTTAFYNIAPNDYFFAAGATGPDAGTLWPGSSVGPTADGRLGVDFSAPGEGFVVPCGQDSHWSSIANQCAVPGGNGKYLLFGAVSGAAPPTTGAVALLLQLNPRLDAAQIKAVLQQSARRDSFTGPAPNPSWGYGKLDVAAAAKAVAAPASAGEATVYEFYAPSLDHYFRTANIDEASVLSGNPNLGWQVTGDNFIGYARTGYPAGAHEVCRFYGSVSPGPNSHFYTADQAECDGLRALQQATPPTEPRWNYEEMAFAVDLREGAACPARAPLPIYRAYNNRAIQNDSNHRYTTDLTFYNALIAQGWKGEGVVMCAVRKG